MRLDTLLSQYRQVIESIETQSCNHAGAKSIGEAWQHCCGVSYEYLNDIAVRDAVADRLALVAPRQEEALQLAELDKRLRVLLDKNHVSCDGPAFWNNGLPFGVVQ